MAYEYTHFSRDHYTTAYEHKITYTEVDFENKAPNWHCFLNLLDILSETWVYSIGEIKAVKGASREEIKQQITVKDCSFRPVKCKYKKAPGLFVENGSDGRRVDKRENSRWWWRKIDRQVYKNSSVLILEFHPYFSLKQISIIQILVAQSLPMLSLLFVN